MKELAVRGEKWARRNGRSPYAVMDTPTIAALPVADIAARDCVLFCWATAPKLEDAFQVIRGWGFTFKTIGFCWVKQNPNGITYPMGLGYWSRQGVELCLLATRGKPQRIDKGVRNLIISPRRDHSRKPDEVYDRIERLVPGPYCELFARRQRPGWTALGNEIDGLDIRTALAQLK